MKATSCFLLFNFFVFTITLLPSAAEEASVEYCNKKAEYAVKVNGVDIDPYPVARGKEATFSISASTGEGISNGKLLIDVKYFFFHVYQETHDLCKETSCPVSSGDFVLSHKQTLPGYTPPGSYTLQMKLLDENNKELTCVTFGFSIGFISPVADG
ncbi:putative phosphatidylglycerol/phosphatidylinositol transfer protein DDB_G0282179 [Phalaenopsis equestris]|uniref:putative phosphatidylglycerol/phosphatidylinositol transfer protein DDB_G0282179 n=1 Tax=Phalaenopsis equestris TaxID=78828 RepID=UPI0009E38AB7|nr:putative phosphatidylglycerol/phosphatidylinositol transfer protein DDB_G0282179 [Phalaenopsis equestris]